MVSHAEDELLEGWFVPNTEAIGFEDDTMDSPLSRRRSVKQRVRSVIALVPHRILLRGEGRAEPRCRPSMVSRTLRLSIINHKKWCSSPSRRAFGLELASLASPSGMQRHQWISAESSFLISLFLLNMLGSCMGRRLALSPRLI